MSHEGIVAVVNNKASVCLLEAFTILSERLHLGNEATNRHLAVAKQTHVGREKLIVLFVNSLGILGYKAAIDCLQDAAHSIQIGVEDVGVHERVLTAQPQQLL